MPPTNFLWLRIDPHGKVMGLYEHNGVEWIKIANGAEGSEDGCSCENVIEKIEQSEVIYATNKEGDQIAITYATTAEGDTIVYRTENGTFQSSAPVEDNDVVNKQYMEEYIQQNVVEIVKPIWETD